MPEKMPECCTSSLARTDHCSEFQTRPMVDHRLLYSVNVGSLELKEQGLKHGCVWYIGHEYEDIDVSTST